MRRFGYGVACQVADPSIIQSKSTRGGAGADEGEGGGEDGGALVLDEKFDEIEIKKDSRGRPLKDPRVIAHDLWAKFLIDTGSLVSLPPY
jgi:hypothetical protein